MNQPENLNGNNRPDNERPSNHRNLRIAKEVVFFTPVMLGTEAYKIEVNEPKQI